MVKDSLGEGLAGGGSTQRGGESKGLNDRQVRLQVEDGSSYNLIAKQAKQRTRRGTVARKAALIRLKLYTAA